MHKCTNFGVVSQPADGALPRPKECSKANHFFRLLNARTNIRCRQSEVTGECCARGSAATREAIALVPDEP
jgi:hypothetical protein